MPSPTRLLLLIAAALPTLASCSGATLLNAAVPSGTYQLRRDVAYGPLERQRLDVYVPRSAWAGPGPRPTVVFVHGGSWESGNKAMYKFVAEALVSQGWVAVVPDYRKYPEIRWPVFVEDCADAVEWTGRHAAEWGGDAGHIVAMGHSAGAQIVTLLALDRRYQVRMPSVARLQGVVGLSGPYDFLPITGPTLREIFATAPDLQETQPIHYARADAAPMLLLHGEADETVWPRNTRNLAAALRHAGSPVQDHYYPEIDHVRMVVALARPFRGHYTVLGDISDFVRRLQGERIPDPQGEERHAPAGGAALEGGRP